MVSALATALVAYALVGRRERSRAAVVRTPLLLSSSAFFRNGSASPERPVSRLSRSAFRLFPGARRRPTILDRTLVHDDGHVPTRRVFVEARLPPKWSLRRRTHPSHAPTATQDSGWRSNALAHRGPGAIACAAGCRRGQRVRDSPASGALLFAGVRGSPSRGTNWCRLVGHAASLEGRLPTPQPSRNRPEVSPRGLAEAVPRRSRPCVRRPGRRRTSRRAVTDLFQGCSPLSCGEGCPWGDRSRAAPLATFP